MYKYILHFWRGNKNNGHNTTREIMANTLEEAQDIANTMIQKISYGSLQLRNIECVGEVKME